MKRAKASNYYILMADVIGSRNKNSKDLIEKFRSVIDTVNRKHRKCMLSPLTITLGDEFQGIIKDMASSIAVIMSIEEEIIKRSADFKLKYVLQYGKVDTAVNEKIAYGMLGSGLTAARANLISSKKNKERRINFFLQRQEDSDLLGNVFYIYTSIKDSWKTADYYLISEFIKGNNYSSVAETLSKDVSLIWKREKTLWIKQYIASKKVIISVISRLND